MSQVQESMDALKVISQVKLPPIAAFKVAGLIQALRDPCEKYDAARNALLATHGAPIADKPGMFTVKDELVEKHFAPLLAKEVKVPDDKLTRSDFGDTPIEPAVLVTLSWCIQL